MYIIYVYNKIWFASENTVVDLYYDQSLLCSSVNLTPIYNNVLPDNGDSFYEFFRGTSAFQAGGAALKSVSASYKNRHHIFQMLTKLCRRHDFKDFSNNAIYTLVTSTVNIRNLCILIFSAFVVHMISIMHINSIKHLFTIDTKCVLCETDFDSRASVLVPKVWDPWIHFCSGYSKVSCFVKNNLRTFLTGDMFISHGHQDI